MTPQLLLYSRKDCCLCDEMKEILHRVAATMPLALKEIDVDSEPGLREKYGDQVPVLFIDGQKAFKYRVTERELKKQITTRTRFRKAFSGQIS
jgi:glutaredoxin